MLSSVLECQNTVDSFMDQYDDLFPNDVNLFLELKMIYHPPNIECLREMFHLCDQILPIIPLEQELATEEFRSLLDERIDCLKHCAELEIYAIEKVAKWYTQCCGSTTMVLHQLNEMKQTNKKKSSSFWSRADILGQNLSKTQILLRTCYDDMRHALERIDMIKNASHQFLTLIRLPSLPVHIPHRSLLILHELLAEYQKIYECKWIKTDFQPSNTAHPDENAQVDPQEVINRFSTTLKDNGSFHCKQTISNLVKIQTSFCPEFSTTLGTLNTSLQNASDQHQNACKSVRTWCEDIVAILDDILDEDDAVMKKKAKERKEALNEDRHRLLSAETALKKCVEYLNASNGHLTSLLNLVTSDSRQTNATSAKKEITIANELIVKARTLVKAEIDACQKMGNQVKWIKLNIKTRQNATELKGEAQNYLKLFDQVQDRQS